MYAMLCYAMLCYAIQCYGIESNPIQSNPIQSNGIEWDTTQHITLHYPTLHFYYPATYMNELADFQYKQFTTFNYPINSFSLLEVGRQNKPRASKIEPAATSKADHSASDHSSHTLDSRSVQCGDTNNPRHTHFSYPLQPIHSITIKNNPNHSSWSSFGGINP